MSITMPSWKDVKDHGEDRMSYHRAHFNVLLEAVEDLTRELKAMPEITSKVNILRLCLDGMVKCFEQAYYDVMNDDRFWIAKTGATMPLSIAELTCIQDALAYANEQITNSRVPVLGAINGDSGEEYDDDEVAEAQQTISNITESIVGVIAMDGGTIVVPA